MSHGYGYQIITQYILEKNDPKLTEFIKKCKNEWCKIVTGKYSGWIKKKSLWGKIN